MGVDSFLQRFIMWESPCSCMQHDCNCTKYQSIPDIGILSHILVKDNIYICVLIDISHRDTTQYGLGDSNSYTIGG